MKKKCIIFGAGTYSQVYTNYLSDSYDVVGYIDDAEKYKDAVVNGIKVLGNSDFLFEKLDRSLAVFVPIGDNNIRVSILEKLKESGFETPSFIHKDTIIHKSVEIGQAVYILPATNVMPSTTISDYTMVSMGVNIAHHNLIEKGCFFSQGVNIGASVHIQEKAYFGIGSTLMTGVKTVGRNSLIGAGAVIIRDVPDGAVLVGNPGKIIRTKEII
ncbi:MAG TPA: acetyltransferase [Cytophagaceae bacterium]